MLRVAEVIYSSVPSFYHGAGFQILHIMNANLAAVGVSYQTPFLNHFRESGLLITGGCYNKLARSFAAFSK